MSRFYYNSKSLIKEGNLWKIFQNFSFHFKKCLRKWEGHQEKE